MKAKIHHPLREKPTQRRASSLYRGREDNHAHIENRDIPESFTRTYLDKKIWMVWSGLFLGQRSILAYHPFHYPCIQLNILARFPGRRLMSTLSNAPHTEERISRD